MKKRLYSSGANSQSLPDWFQYPFMALYICLLYKQVVAGLLMLLICSGISFIVIRDYRAPPSVTTAFAGLLAITYTGLSTISAFMVSWPGGVERTIQFALTLLSAIAIAGYLHSLGAPALERFRARFSVLNLAILTHVIIYHLLTGHFVTWKYLYDTKFIFSAIIIVTFLFEDYIRSRGIVRWLTTLSLLTVLVLMSGERKAYLLLVAIFFLSRGTTSFKAIALGTAALFTLIFTSISPDSYISRQIYSETMQVTQLSNRFFFTVESIGQRSDYIRTFVNRNAQLLFEAHPIFGTGSTGYANWAQKKYGSLAISRGLSMNVHGERYRVPAEHGIVGIIVVLGFFLFSIIAALRFAWLRGRLESNAYARFPLYMVTLLCTYAYGEAMDTTMLLLILLTGFAAATPATKRFRFRLRGLA